MYPDKHSRAAEDLAAIRQMMEKAGGNSVLSESWFCACGSVWILTGFCQVAIGFLRNVLWAGRADLYVLRQMMHVTWGITGARDLAVCLLYWQSRKKLGKTGGHMGLQIMDIWFAVLIIIPVLLLLFGRAISLGAYGNSMAAPAAACSVIAAVAMCITSASLRNRSFMLLSILYLAVVYLVQIFPVCFTANAEGVGQSVFCLSDTIIKDIAPGVFLLLLGLRRIRNHNV